MSLTSPEQPVQGQDQPVAQEPTAPPIAAAPPAPVVQTPAPAPGPWVQDLTAIFADESTRGQVDQFIRDKVQPYTTRLEQETAAAKDAVNLWKMLEDDPVTTYVQMTQEMFGEAAAQQVLSSLQGALESQQQPAPPDAQYQSPAQQLLDPRLSSVVDYVEQQQQTQWYEQELNRVASEPQNADITAELGWAIHPFVNLADGDFDQAVQMYREYRNNFGVPAQTPAAPPPPQVMGSDTASAQPSSAPVEPRKETLDQAIEGFIRDQRQSAAPPVGSV